ncbi:hypothetical protein C8F01DRAFT_1264765 [Mycena amicta]|nr:hypothetical protein C8F01DRAFT_1264765 [Mycena amicta]
MSETAISRMPVELLQEVFSLAVAFDFLPFCAGEIPRTWLSFLRVCKQWASVGISIAYRTIIMRPRDGTIDHIQDLAQMLEARDLGPMIRTVHIEDGCGIHVRKILHLASELEILSVDLRWSHHSVDGLYAGILDFAEAERSPTTLLIHDDEGFVSKTRQSVMDALELGLPKWKHLETLSCWPYDWDSRLLQSWRFIKNIPKLRRLVAKSVFVEDEIDHLMPDSVLWVDTIRRVHKPRHANLRNQWLCTLITMDRGRILSWETHEIAWRKPNLAKLLALPFPFD